MNHDRSSANHHALVCAAVSYFSLLLSYLIRFIFLRGAESYPLSIYHAMAFFSGIFHYIAYNIILDLIKDERRYGYQVQRIIICETIWLLALLSLFFISGMPHFSRLLVLLSWGLNIGVISFYWLFVLRYIAQRNENGEGCRNILLVGEGENADTYAHFVAANADCGHRLIGHIASSPQAYGCPYIGAFDSVASALSFFSPDEVIIALPAAAYVHIDAIISACESQGIPLRIIPCYEKRITSRIVSSKFDDIQMIRIRDVPLNRLYNAIIKRFFDVVISLFVLILFSPLFLLIALGVKLSTHESVFFVQTRIGKDKKPFQMLKFRSMKSNPSEETAWSAQSDSRRTPFGALIRKTSLDELPQFINVLRGDMSIIGPRPEIPRYVDQFKQEIPLYMVRHCVKPGITGLAQVNGFRGDTSIPKRLEYDIFYIENWTIWMDIRILLKTFTALINDEQLP